MSLKVSFDLSFEFKFNVIGTLEVLYITIDSLNNFPGIKFWIVILPGIIVIKFWFIKI